MNAPRCSVIALRQQTILGLSLLLGFVLALTMAHPFPARHKKWSHYLLQMAVVGLGFGMNIHSALQAGSDGTAICGGSAIAAIAPLVQAKEADISVAMGTIFLLNAVALFLFPWIGHLLHMTSAQFGLWAAIAIHDTSSVIGAAGKYSAQSLELATAVKLARALWIIPVSLITLVVMKLARKFTGRSGGQSGGDNAQKIAIPWFIFIFIGVIAENDPGYRRKTAHARDHRVGHDCSQLFMGNHA